MIHATRLRNMSAVSAAFAMLVLCGCATNVRSFGPISRSYVVEQETLGGKGNVAIYDLIVDDSRFATQLTRNSSAVNDNLTFHGGGTNVRMRLMVDGHTLFDGLVYAGNNRFVVHGGGKTEIFARAYGQYERDEIELRIIELRRSQLEGGGELIECKADYPAD